MSAILIIAIFIGGLSIYEVDNYIQRESRQLIEVTCENEATKINNTFESMENSVRIMENYILSFFTCEEDVYNRDKQDEAIRFADEMFVNVAKNTDGAIAYYLRLNPDLADGKTGVFYSKTEGRDDYLRFEPTDLTIYDRHDTEHVGWYWQPYEAGEPIWLMPYYNQNNRILMISYVIPLYYGNTFIGVVGMDFDYTVLTDIIHNIHLYEHGYAHLEYNDVIIHSSTDIAKGASLLVDSADYLRVSKVLSNGMTLVLSASYDDIRQIQYDITFDILFAVLFFTLVFSLLVIFMVKRIVKPLKRLTAASVKLSDGDYDVQIEHSNISEINLLCTAFEKMTVNLREHKKLQHQLSHRDSLTGLRNTTSYKSWVAVMDSKIREGGVSFGVAVLDINSLKETNDKYGHILGNELIVTASGIICDTFKRSPVFRIGGDEFCVILQNKDLEDKDVRLACFDATCAASFIEKDGVKLPVSIAKGFAEFDPAKDTQFSDVFERADEEMYVNKKIMKSASK